MKKLLQRIHLNNVLEPPNRSPAEERRGPAIYLRLTCITLVRFFSGAPDYEVGLTALQSLPRGPSLSRFSLLGRESVLGFGGGERSRAFTVEYSETACFVAAGDAWSKRASPA